MLQAVAPGISRISHGVSNFYMVEQAGKIILVDAGVSGDWGILNQALASSGHSLRDLQAVLLTHAHSDHTGFAERARSTGHSTVWVHEADARVAQGDKPAKNERGVGGYLRHGEAWRTVIGLLLHGGTAIAPILEVSGFTDGQTLDVAGRPRVVHVPGHTRGSAALVLEGPRVVFTGDALVTRNPLTGRKGPQIMPRALNQGSQQALDSLAKLENIGADLVLPGHGEPWTRGVSSAVRMARTAGFS